MYRPGFIVRAVMRLHRATLASAVIKTIYFCLFWSMAMLPAIGARAETSIYRIQFLPRFGMTDAEMPSDLSARPTDSGAGRPSRDATTRSRTGIGRSHYLCVPEGEDRVAGGSSPDTCRR